MGVDVHGAVSAPTCAGSWSWVLHNPDSVCNILESLDCLFVRNV